MHNKKAAKLIKNAIKNHTHENDFYPTIDDIENIENEFVPLALQTFVKELVKPPELFITSYFCCFGTKNSWTSCWTSCLD